MSSLSHAPAAVPVAQANDSLVGVCAAIGEDFGFPANLLRVAFGAGLLFSLELVLAAYAALGVVVLAARVLFPNTGRPAPAPAVTPAPVPEPAEADKEAEELPALARAA
jgi:phage shock protein C